MSMFFVVVLMAGTLAASSQAASSFRITITQPGVLQLGEEIAAGLQEVEKNLTVIKIPDTATDGYKLTKIEVSELHFSPPHVQVVQGVGVLWRQAVPRAVIQGDYKIKALFFWVDGKMTLTTALTLELTAGIETVGEKLVITNKQCSVTYTSFHLDLHNLVFTTFADTGKIKEHLQKTLCDKASTAMTEIEIMEHIPYITNTEEDKLVPKAVFKSDRIEVSAGTGGPIPAISNRDNRMICLTISKNLLEKSGGDKIKKMAIFKKAKRYIPVLSEKNVSFKMNGDFLEMCADIYGNEKLF